MKRIVSEHQLGFFATVCEGGSPNLSLKGTDRRPHGSLTLSREASRICSSLRRCAYQHRSKRAARRPRAGGEEVSRLRLRTVSAKAVDEYLRALEEPKRSTLRTMRRTILEIVPEADQVISYRVPAFRVSGKTVAGFAAFKDHLSYLPFSGSVLGQLGDELEGYKMTKSSLHFPVDRPLPKALVKKLIRVRLADVGRRAR